MCKRSDQDAGWCISHHSDFLPAALSCEAIIRPDSGRGRRRAAAVESPFTRMARARSLPGKVLGI